MQPAHRLAGLQEQQVFAHGLGGGVAALQVRVAGLQHHFIQLEQRAFVRECVEVFGEFWEIVSILSAADFVNDFAEAEHVGGGATGAFRRHEALRTDKGV